MRSTEIPDGYILLRDAFDRFGRVRFGTDWTGAELGPQDPSPEPPEFIGESDIERLEEVLLGHPDPAPRPDPRSDLGRRRDKAEQEFRQILYKGRSQAFLYRTYDGTLIEIPNNYWLSDKFFVIFEFSYGTWLNSEHEECRGDVLFKKLEFDYFINDFDSFDSITVLRSPSSDTNKRLTAAAGTKCEQWIRDKANSKDPGPRRKDDLFREASKKFDGLSRKAFIRAWDNAAPEEWKRPGQKKKLGPRIDTPE